MRDSITIHKMVKYHLPRSNQKDNPLPCQVFVVLRHPTYPVSHLSYDRISLETTNYLAVKRTFQPELSIEPNCHAIAPSGRIAAATNLWGEKISGNQKISDKYRYLEARRGG